MKTFTTAALLAFGLVATCTAAEYTGFVEDTLCSAIGGMKSDAECARKCIKAGKAAVLVTADGTIYKIADQDKIVGHAGHNVAITGELKGDTISITGVTEK